LFSWKKLDKLQAAVYHRFGIAVSARFFKVPAVGSGHFAYVTSMRIPNADPLYTVDEEASRGSFFSMRRSWPERSRRRSSWLRS
jgi:hypothetical protein